MSNQQPEHSSANPKEASSGIKVQWPTTAMSDSSPIDTGLERESTSSGQDESGHQPNSSEEDGSECQPPSSEEDELGYKPRRPQKTNKYVETHGELVILDQYHLRADIDLEVGTAISIGETLVFQDGSFLKITHFGRSKNIQSVTIFGHLLKCIGKFQDDLPVNLRSTELVWVCEAKEYDDKLEGYLKSATSNDVLRIRHLVARIPEFASKSVPQSEATGMFMDSRSLFCQWMLVAELSKSRITRGKRRSKSTMTGSQG